jgi:hypothetical protein
MDTARIAISAQLCALGIFVVLVNVYNIQIFNNKLCPLAESTNNANKTAIIMIHDRLIDLKYLLNNKASAQDIMALVHGNLHPGLQVAYNLKLKQ